MFQFKKFVVHDSASTMKVGTDAILLGCWANINSVNTVLEVGCGCGVISLILAQRIQNAIINAIDIDKNSVEESNRNFASSAWGNRLTASHTSIQEYTEKATKQYELIVSNPPYFNNSLLSELDIKKKARHTTHLSFIDLITCVKKLLTATGTFCCILPYNEGVVFKDLAAENQLFCKQNTTVYTKQNKPAKRSLMEFTQIEADTINNNLYIYNTDNSYTNEYLRVVKDFYLFV